MFEYTSLYILKQSMYMLPPRMYIYTYIYIYICAVLLYLLILSYIICDAPPFFEQL